MMAFRKVKIDWKKKAMAYRIFDRMTMGYEMYLWTQKHVTKTVPRALTPTAETAQRFLDHFMVFREFYEGDPQRARYFEFGAGWDLYSNIVLWCLGIERQTVFDLRRWAQANHVNHIIGHLQHDPPPGFIRYPKRLLGKDTFEKDLLRFYGIEYRAPADASNTGIPSGTIDLIATTSVLEHIPRPNLDLILQECHRLAHTETIHSHVIDYSDHYAHSDASITPYNFLQFGDTDWKKYNPGIHFQNRLRHRDYAAIFQSKGFSIVRDTPEIRSTSYEDVRKVKPSSAFAHYTAEELVPLVGHYVLKKNAL